MFDWGLLEWDGVSKVFNVFYHLSLRPVKRQKGERSFLTFDNR